MNSYTIVLPTNTKPFTDLFMVALCIYREARGESMLAKRAVASTIRNRVNRPGWWGKDWFTVVTKPYQFSSFLAHDPNCTVFGAPDDPAWRECVQAAFDIMVDNHVDPTGGATNYYDKSLDGPGKQPPAWAATQVFLCQIGAFKFFKEKQ